MISIFVLAVCAGMVQAKSQASTPKVDTPKGHRTIATWKHSPAIVKAAEKNDLEKVKKLLDKEINPNSVSKEKYNRKRTALEVAAENNNMDMVQLLVNAGATDKEGLANGANTQTALSAATKNNNLEMVQFLLNNGILPINDAGTPKNTVYPKNPLFRIMGTDDRLGECVHDKNTEAIIKLLTENGADINDRSYVKCASRQEACYDRTPLINVFRTLKADSSRHAKCIDEKVKLLVKLGADVNVRDDFGHSPLFYAILGGYDKTAQFLEKEGTPLTDEEKKELEETYANVIYQRNLQQQREQERAQGNKELLDIFVKGVGDVAVGVATKVGDVPAATAAQVLVGISDTTSSGNGTCGDSKHQFTGATCDKCVNNKPRTNAACAACCATLGKPIADNRYWPNGRAPKDGFTRPGCYCVFTDGSANIF